MGMQDDFTPGGTKIEGAYENDRNAQYSQLYKAMIRECFGVSDVIIAHHLVYITEETRADGFKYQIVEEIPSADSLLFDHDIVKKIWPETWKEVLVALALEPVETRDAKCLEFFEARLNEKAAMENSGVGDVI